MLQTPNIFLLAMAEVQFRAKSVGNNTWPLSVGVALFKAAEYTCRIRFESLLTLKGKTYI